MNNIKNRLSLVMGYLGAVVGAGFASGQEIVQFFVAYGLDGKNGCIVAMLVFAVCGGLLMYIAHKHSISTYQDILHHLMGEKLSRIIDFTLAVFLFLGISMMLSASGAVFHEHLHMPKELGIMLACILVASALYTGKKGLITTYNILVPIKLLLLLIITGYAAFIAEGVRVETHTVFLSQNYNQMWMISAVLYVAYNFALAMVVLSGYQTVGSRREGVSGAMLGGLVLGILLLFYYLALSKFLPVILHYEVPMLYIVGSISTGTKIVYTLVLWVGIITTAIANAYGFAQRFASSTHISYGLSLFITLILSLPIALQSFSALVSKVYPLFGILGIIIMVVLITKAMKQIIAEMI